MSIPQSRANVESRVAELYPTVPALLGLASEQHLPQKGLPAAATPNELIDAIFEQARRHGRLKGLLRSCLRAHPNDPVLREALRRDPRFAGEPGIGRKNPVISAAASLREAVISWKPTHLWSLDPAARRLTTLLSGSAGNIDLVGPPSDPISATSTLESLAAEAENRRVVLVLGDRRHMETARVLVEQAQALPIELRIMLVDGAP